ncbi:periplasmic chaperone for outer membrane proteins SurA [Pontibacter ummariensis]|uniref:Periplasmic chaperone for outer membrane proteins SurA n=1 Tax=Pontibacter ummariensis TaxID=1610492 RepID=A0A239B4W2_9BACT|nr:peptidylprolyl isomerase [Pontibacter ummariensis]PRY16271.1 periplasmic chaperone for outer membrane proteins SurA [Pontibacter ummariensis]SNS02264.1 periplasmic chaperone for outer membrane proteins SurA [Pontibacter ummariensis]
MRKIHHFAKTAFAALCLIALSVSAYAQTPVQRKVDGIIAKVDNHVILRSDLEFGYLQYLSQSKQQPSEELKCQLFTSLLQDKLLLARAEIDSVTVEEPMVSSELDRRIQYLASQVGGVERLEQYYNKSVRQLKDELRKTIKEQLVMEKMQQQITGKVTVTPKEIKKYFNAIPADSLPYFSSEVEIGQIVKHAQVSRQQKQEAREKLEALRQRILAGEDFATLAKQYSQDPGSAAAGGELGFFKKKELVPEYEAAALRLEPGGISNVIESQFGFHLIQLIERKGQEFNTRHILIKPATATVDVEETIAELDSIRTLIVNDSISFAKAAKEFSDDKNTKDNGGMLMSRATGSTYIPMDQVDPSIFFVIDTMQVGDISKPIPFTTEDGREAVRIVSLKSKSKPHLANLKDDYQKIANAALGQKRSKAVDAWFRKNIGTVYIEIDPEYQDCGGLQQLMQ